MKQQSAFFETAFFRRVLVLSAAAIWTLLVIQFSARHGRLAHEVAYDDGMYMFDALWRLLAFDRGGLQALIETIRVVFPHSPGMTLQGMLSFTLFGVNDVAPYILNLLPVWLYLHLTRKFAHDADKWKLILIILTALSFQISYVMVHEFRPDPSYAVMTAAAVAFAFGNITTERASRWLPALLMAGTLYMKPTFFLNSIFIYGLIWGVQSVTSWQKLRASEGEGKTAIRTLQLHLPALALFTALTAPLFILHFNYFWEYLVRNAFGDEQNIWKIQGGAFAAVKFFTVGWGGEQMLGKSLYPAILLILCGATSAALFRKTHHLYRTLILFGFSLAALFVMAVGQLNTPFFGLTFHFLLVLSAICGIAPFLSDNSRWIRMTTTVMLLLATIYNFSHLRSYSASPVNPMQVPVMSIVDKRHSIVQEILNAIEPEVMPRNYVEEAEVFVGFVGSLSALPLRWAAAKRGIPVKFKDFDRNEDLEAYKEAISDCDFVLTAAEGAPELSLYLPTVEHHARVHEWVAANPHFVEIANFPTYGTGGFHLFKREKN